MVAGVRGPRVRRLSFALVVVAAVGYAQAGASEPGTVFRDCADCPLMVVIPSGTFTMGSPDDAAERDRDEGPQHPVAIAHPLAVSIFEVTRGEFAQFIGDTGYATGEQCNVWTGTREERIAGKSWQNHNFPQTDKHPVVCISWDDAKAYIAWLSRKTGKPYRFLSEAEWEYAARAGAAGKFSFGNDDEGLCKYGNVADATARKGGGPATWQYTNCSDGFGMTTAPVGSFAANTFGLHDMHGNVWEWLGDCYRDSYAGAPSDGSAWMQEPCTRRAVRGGGWSYAPKFNRSADRNGDRPAVYGSNLGLRVARAP